MPILLSRHDLMATATKCAALRCSATTSNTCTTPMGPGISLSNDEAIPPKLLRTSCPRCSSPGPISSPGSTSSKILHVPEQIQEACTTFGFRSLLYRAVRRAPMSGCRRHMKKDKHPGGEWSPPICRVAPFDAGIGTTPFNFFGFPTRKPKTKAMETADFRSSMPDLSTRKVRAHFSFRSTMRRSPVIQPYYGATNINRKKTGQRAWNCIMIMTWSPGMTADEALDNGRDTSGRNEDRKRRLPIPAGWIPREHLLVLGLSGWNANRACSERLETAGYEKLRNGQWVGRENLKLVHNERRDRHRAPLCSSTFRPEKILETNPRGTPSVGA